MMRTILAVIVGYAVWPAICLPLNTIFYSETSAALDAGQRFAQTGPLVGSIGISILGSLAAGFVAAFIATSHTKPAVWIVAALLLLTGIGVEASVWPLIPVWYHFVFLALLVPVVMLGARLTGTGRRQLA